MEQIYQMAWILVLLLVSANMTVYYLSPFYLCPNGDCPNGLLQSIRPTYDVEKIRTSFESTQSTAQASSTSTPPGFWELVGKSGGFFEEGAGILWGSFASISTIAFYYAYDTDSVLFAIIRIFTTLFSVIEIIAFVFLAIYLAGLVRGVKA